MISIKLDENMDIKINSGTGEIETVSEGDYLAQKIKLLLGTNLGELPWNDKLGFNQFNLIAAADNLTGISSMINDYLKQHLDGFSSINITNLNVNKNSRIANFEADITMKNGDQTTTIFKIGDEN